MSAVSGCRGMKWGRLEERDNGDGEGDRDLPESRAKKGFLNLGKPSGEGEKLGNGRAWPFHTGGMIRFKYKKRGEGDLKADPMREDQRDRWVEEV
ncbi:MAG: hypothetical protein GX442_12365 [Candidatus Riflebacteria bacterium]|nr:hypothetical protein [Candidatus Riflebacteria bacterium]